jgi:UDP-N-acetylglucosamine:LPS N-acetylglucosamine transferase
MKKIRILAVSSSGGHWIQLNRLRPFLDGFETIYASTDDSLGDVFSENYHSLKDANMWDKPGLVVLAFQVFWLLLKVRPDVIVSTGAAPGFFALMFGKILMRKTIWIDSMANADEMSLAGKKIKPFADIWLTQWEELSLPEGPGYQGQVL